MKLLAGTFLLGLVFALPRPAPAAAGPAASTPTIIILDASGSMRERIKGETKIEIAKRAVRELVGALPADARLGLVVYGHRSLNDCDDIELLIPPGPVDQAVFVAAVEGIKPRGMTPLSAAMVFAARALDYIKRPANIILVSDGVETCGNDPCATAARLKATGLNLIVHTVGFDLSPKAARSIACIAASTGGRFLQAKDAASLKDALSLAVAESVIAAAPAPQPVAVITPATLKVPPSVVAGAVFPVEWTGSNDAGDMITIVPAGVPDSEDGNLVYTRQGTPVHLTALLDPGSAEVRYVAGRSHAVLARATVKIAAATEATLTSAAEAAAGSAVSVTWRGPNNEGDFITIVPQKAGDSDYDRSAPTRDGSPVVVAAPMDAGDAEVRYLSGQSSRVLARRAIKILPPHVSLAAADEALAGSVVSITWDGPNYPNDYLTIVAAGVADGERGAIAYTMSGSPVQVAAPGGAGVCEIRYMSGWGDKVLARRAIKIVAAEVTLTARDEGVAGSDVPITWSGPNNENDYITIVGKTVPDGHREGFAWTLGGSPLQVTAPGPPGDAEIRYVSGHDDKVLARRVIKIVAAKITLTAPARAPLGAPVAIEWTGPNNPNDHITIVPKGAPEGASGHSAWTAAGSPANVDPPDQSGPCEVRYINGQDDRVLARIPLEIVAGGT
jgi:Ca-activated chloride channel family protein